VETDTLAAAAPPTSSLLTQWTWEPSILIGVLVFGAGYFYLVGPMRRDRAWGPPPSQGQVTAFVLSFVTLVVALLSPLDYIGDHYLFSAHMVQHLLLATIWPPLFLAGIPSWLAAPFFRRRILSGIFLFLAYPAVAVILFNADIYAWHIPALYDQTLHNEGIHILEHLSFMALGVLVWWPVLSPVRSQRLSYPLQLLYLFANGMFMMGLGIVFTFASSVFYSPYASAPRLWGISAVNDQQLGGLVMWYPGNAPYALMFVLAFYRWFESEQSQPADNLGLPAESPTIGPPVS
jgi:putative membrane protein